MAREKPPQGPDEDDAEARSGRAFFGRSGQFAAMAELLHRRINVAIPEVDVGDDVFVVRGLSADVVRVQVKAATAQEQKNGYVALVNVPGDHLLAPHNEPPLVYVFPIRRGEESQGRWSDFLVIDRGTLRALFEQERAGTRNLGTGGRAYVQFRIVFTETTARSGPGRVDLQPFRDAWEPWPPPATLADADGLPPEGK